MEEAQWRTRLSQQQSEKRVTDEYAEEEYFKILAILRELEKAADEAPIQKRLQKVADEAREEAASAHEEHRVLPQGLSEEVERVLAAYQAFMVLTEEEQRTLLNDVLFGLSPETKRRVLTEVVRSIDRSTERVDLIATINRNLPLGERDAVIVTTLENLPPSRREYVVSRLLALGLLPPRTEEDVKAATSQEEGETDHPVEVHFTDKAYGVINDLIKGSRTASSLSAVLTQALAFEKWYRDTVAAGNRVLVERGKGNFREVKRP